jgi:hypothetical protein
MDARTMNADEQDASAEARPFGSSPSIIQRAIRLFDRAGLATLAIGGIAWGSLAVAAWLLTNLLYL